MAKTAEVEGKVPAKSDKKKAAQPSKPNFFARLAQYFRDVRSEMTRVVWPTRNEVLNSSVVVIVTLVFFTALLFVIDTVAVQVVDLISRIKIG